MRLTAAFVGLNVLATMTSGQVNTDNHWVEGYYKQDGTYVQGHYATDPNYTNRDNYSTYPNTNPWTGEQGTVAPDNNPTPVPQYPQPGGVRVGQSGSVGRYGGSPIFVATSGQIPWGAVQQRRQLSPQERAARAKARALHRERLAANRRHRQVVSRAKAAAREQLRQQERARKATEKAKKSQ